MVTQITLEAARVNSGFTQKQAANSIGINDQTLAKYEKDSSNIPVSLVGKLSRLYHVPQDCLFLGKKYEFIRSLLTT